MKVIFDVTKARVTENGFTAIFDFQDTGLRQEVEVANLKDLLAKFETYRAQVETTGKPYKVDFRQARSDRSRKFPGFDKAANVNYFTKAAETATEEDLENA